MISRTLYLVLLSVTSIVTAVPPTDYKDNRSDQNEPLQWAWFQVAPVGWHYVSSKGGVDTFFRSEGKPAMDTMMLCSGVDFNFRNSAANTFCTSPNEAANIIFLGFTSSG